MKKVILKSTLLISLMIGFSACSEELVGTVHENKSSITCHNNLEINIIGHNTYSNGVFYNIDKNTGSISQCKTNVEYKKIELLTECFKGLQILSLKRNRYSNEFLYNRKSDTTLVKCNSSYIQK